MRVWRLAGRFGGIAALLLLVGGVLASGVWRHLSMADLRLHHRELVAWVASRPVLSFSIFIGAMAAVAAACLPATGILVALGGVLFGTLLGGAGALVGSTLGSCAVFLACRAASGGWLERGADTRIARIAGALSKSPFSNLLVLRLTPIAPLSLVNIAAGLAQVRLLPFIASSLLGSAPSNFIYAGLGGGLRSAFAKGAALDTSLAANPGLLWPLAALCLLAALTGIANLARRR